MSIVSHKTRAILVTCFVIAVIVGLLAAVLWLVNNPVTVTEQVEVMVTEYVEVPVEVAVTEVVTVTEFAEVPVEVEVAVPVELQQFESLDALREWLGEGKYTLLLPPGEKPICWHYALNLQDKARKSGYDIYFQAVWPNVYNSFFTLMQVSTPHAINATIIQGDVYFIEPQTREIVLAGWLKDYK